MAVGLAVLDLKAPLRGLSGRGAFSWFGALLGVACLSAVVRVGGTGFDSIEAVKFFAKMFLYGLALITIPTCILTLGSTSFLRLMRWGLYLNIAVGILQQIGHRSGTSIGLFQAYGVTPWDRSDWPRVQGLFSEPATFTIFAVLLVVVVYSMGRLRLSDVFSLVVVLALTASVIGFALAGLIGLLAVIERNQLSNGDVLRVVGAVALVVTAALLVPASRGVIEDRFVSRVENTFASGGSDASGQARLFDSWTAAVEVVDGQTLFGVGPGNYVVGLRQASDEGRLDNVDARIVESGGGWNLFANVFAELGVIGVLVLIAGIWSWTRPRWSGFVVLIGIGFATGTFLGWSWWLACMLVSLSVTIARREDAEAIADPASTDAAGGAPGTVDDVVAPVGPEPLQGW